MRAPWDQHRLVKDHYLDGSLTWPQVGVLLDEWAIQVRVTSHAAVRRIVPDETDERIAAFLDREIEPFIHEYRKQYVERWIAVVNLREGVAH
jgi:hypothetical protein